MKLSDWLAGNDLEPPRKRMTYAQFAVRIDSSTAAVGAYCDGRDWPGRDKMKAIVRETGGAVTPNDFLHSEAAE